MEKEQESIRLNSEMCLKIKSKRRRQQQRMRCLGGITDLMDMSLNKLQGGDGQRSLMCYSPWGRKELDVTEQLH